MNSIVHGLEFTAAYQPSCLIGAAFLDILGVSEASATAIWSVDTLQGEIAASLAWHLSIAPDFPSFAFVTGSPSAQGQGNYRLQSLPCDGYVAASLRPGRGFRAILPLPLGGAWFIVLGWWLRSSLLKDRIMVRIVVHDCAPDRSLFVQRKEIRDLSGI